MNIRDKDGYTVLHVGMQKDNNEMSEYIIEKGGDINIRDEEG